MASIPTSFKIDAPALVPQVNGLDDVMNNLPLPEPIVRVTHAIDYAPDEVPGEIKVDKEGKLLKSYLQYSGFSKFLIEGFNHWTDVILPQQVSSFTIPVNENIHVRFSPNVRLNPPTRPTERAEPIYPKQARDSAMTYSADLYVFPELVIGDRVISTYESNPVHAGKIPVMLGSKYCYLSDIPESERYTVGECECDPLGYFVAKGTEKIVLIQENLRMNRSIVTFDPKKGGLSCRMTCPTIRGSTMVVLTSNAKKAIRVSLHMMGKEGIKNNTMGLYQIYRLLGISDTDQITQMILDWVPKKYHRRVALALEPSIVEARIVSDDLQYLCDLRRKRPEECTDETKSKLLNKLLEELFPQISFETESAFMDSEYPADSEEYNVELATKVQYMKLSTLSMMAAQTAGYLCGVEKLTNRDSWSNKRLEPAARSVEKLFVRLWERLVKNTTEYIESHKAILDTGRETSIRTFFEDVCNAIRSNDTITKELESSFSSNAWGIRKVFTKENITVEVKRESLLAVYSQLMQINTPTSRQAKQPLIRLVQNTQLGYICPAETPEGEACGLTKNLAVTCITSMEHDDSHIREALRRFGVDVFTDQPDKVILNGKFVGRCIGQELYRQLVQERRRQAIPFDTCLVYDSKKGVLNIYCDAGRPIRPLLVVNQETENLVITEKGLWGRPFAELLQEGAVEYIDPWEQEYIMLAMYVDDINARLNEIKKLQMNISDFRRVIDQDVFPTSIGTLSIDTREIAESYLNQAIEQASVIRSKTSYTHSEMDPSAIWGISASIMPASTHNQGPRVTFQAGMAKQALGIYSSNYANRFDTSAKVLMYPTRPMFETQMHEVLGLNKLPQGENVIIAFMTAGGFNQEDAFYFKKGAIERGLFHYMKLSSYKAVLNQTDCNERRGVLERMKSMPKFHAINPTTGLPRVGTVVKEGDVLIAKFKVCKDGREEDSSVKMKAHEKGVVDRILVTTNADGKEVIKVKVRTVRMPIIGDKYASRYAQKGTIGIILDDADMPFVTAGRNAGVSPDIIVNPHAFASRMTVGKLIEILVGKVGAAKGERINATSFRKFDLESMQQSLRDHGFQNLGYETMTSGTTGNTFESRIYMGPCYYQALKHHVIDKIQGRSTGSVDTRTRQPTGGRRNYGGQRIGEMEHDAFVSHGGSSILNERLCKSSSAYTTVFCKNCGTIASTSVVDQTFYCRKCRVQGDFGRMTIPYSFKLLTHLLAGVGINMGLKLSKKKTEGV